MKVTMKEIAERAGVHPSTVDKVVHHRVGVSDEVRARVQTIINELGYTPNPSGRVLQRQGKVYRISAILVEVDALPYLKKGGTIVVNNQQISPMPVITGAAEYPKSLEQKLATLPIRLDAMDALGLALQAGSAKAVNLVLLGRLSKYFHFTDAQWQDAICRSVPAKFLELNRKAFALGAEG